MTKIKLCGIRKAGEIACVNLLKPDYIGFVFAKKSRRYITPREAGQLKAMLHPSIKAAGVFVDEKPETVAELAGQGVIDVVQLHGHEDESYLRSLREMIKIPVMQAFCITSEEDVKRAEQSSADMVLMDAGAGCGEVFDWNLLKDRKRPFFLAGGLTPENVPDAIKALRPYGVDASSSLETDGLKDSVKMTAFVEAVRGKEE